MKEHQKEKARADISKKIRPLADRVIIREYVNDQEIKTISGIILPSHASDDKQGKRGVVVAVGPGRIEEGTIRALSVTVGDTVIFQWGDKISLDGLEYYVVRESEILAVVS